ncbi:MAG: DUF4277 domain-containing protein [Firmicutes bacterium]|nr:DUF4277 domain-containing protein [Bacillota bacterium]
MAEKIGLIEVCNRLLPWDPRQSKVSPGERILAMILDILTGKSPLYRYRIVWPKPMCPCC